MTLIIECETPFRAYRWTLRPGECACIGRSHWVEFSIPEDLHLQNEHLEIDYSNKPEWTWLSEPPADTSPSLSMKPGRTNRKSFTLGSTLIQLTWMPSSSFGDCDLDDNSQIASVGRAKLSTSWKADHAGLIDIGIQPNIVHQLDGFDTRTLAIHQWKEKRQASDLLRLISWELEHKARPEWLTSAIPYEIIRAEARRLVDKWNIDPSEANRQTAQHSMQTLESSTLEYWLLGSIAWTGGSLCAEPNPVIAPPKSLVVLAAVTALQLASSQFPAFGVVGKAIEIGLERLAMEDSALSNYTPTEGIDACRS